MRDWLLHLFGFKELLTEVIMSKTVKEIYESRQEAFVVVFDRTLTVSQNFVNSEERFEY